MSVTIWACTSQPDWKGECSSGYAQVTIDNDLATALNNHAVALQNNTDAMNDFFNLSVDYVSLISASILIFFIVGNSVGKIASLMRKV